MNINYTYLADSKSRDVEVNKFSNSFFLIKKHRYYVFLLVEHIDFDLENILYQNVKNDKIEFYSLLAIDPRYVISGVISKHKPYRKFIRTKFSFVLKVNCL